MTFGDDYTRRRPSLTPMIDVVFLLLVFFMLASRFGVDQVLPLSLSGQGGATYSGAPRIVDIAPDTLRLNGVAVAEGDLGARLTPLTTASDDTIVLRGQDGAHVQRIIDIAEMLSGAGFTALVLVE